MGTLQRIWGIYIAVGAPIASIKLLSVLTWSSWHTWAAVPTINGAEVSVVGTFVLGLLNAMLAFVAWPLVVYQALNGSPLTELLFHPWVSTAYD